MQVEIFLRYMYLLLCENFWKKTKFVRRHMYVNRSRCNVNFSLLLYVVINCNILIHNLFNILLKCIELLESIHQFQNCMAMQSSVASSVSTPHLNLSIGSPQLMALYKCQLDEAKKAPTVNIHVLVIVQSCPADITALA